MQKCNNKVDNVFAQHDTQMVKMIKDLKYFCSKCKQGINPYYYAMSNEIDINDCSQSFSLINKDFGLINHLHNHVVKVSFLACKT